jgi:hypothetical protein
MYMKRPDLAGKCGSTSSNGWQAVDATPQERSVSGKYQCGPMPVKFVKENCDAVGFDGEFIIGEVNADINLWVKNGSTWTYYDKFTTDPFDEFSTIGQQISTKMVGESALDDITSSYKRAEPSGPGAATKPWDPSQMVSKTESQLDVQVASTEEHERLRMQLKGPVKLEVTVCGGGKCKLGKDVDFHVAVKGRSADVSCRLLAKAFDQDYDGTREGKILLQGDHVDEGTEHKTFTASIAHQLIAEGRTAATHVELKLWVTGKCSNGQVMAWRRKLRMH